MTKVDFNRRKVKKFFHDAALSAEKEYQQQQSLAIRVVRDVVGNNNVTIVGSSFTPNTRARIETMPRDVTPRVLTCLTSAESTLN
jgi:hypothetical protein